MKMLVGLSPLVLLAMVHAAGADQAPEKPQNPSGISVPGRSSCALEMAQVKSAARRLERPGASLEDYSAYGEALRRLQDCLKRDHSNPDSIARESDGVWSAIWKTIKTVASDVGDVLIQSQPTLCAGASGMAGAAVGGVVTLVGGGFSSGAKAGWEVAKAANKVCMAE